MARCARRSRTAGQRWIGRIGVGRGRAGRVALSRMGFPVHGLSSPIYIYKYTYIYIIIYLILYVHINVDIYIYMYRYVYMYMYIYVYITL